MDTDSPPPVPTDISNSTGTRSALSQQQQTTTRNSAVNFSSSMRNNEVRTVMLYGVPIVALVMENQERLCLAQISNTLLKNFSYNEIHNRRVALGITCVQCTPVQLELLRRAGAMPVSSRRCGMITKREAERLCKSFLAETAPPKLPDTFAFDIYHHCAWGCRGNFTPSRYNSSRAKCIKCSYCGLFFSPNKFIFHSHRLPDSKYVQPDAANFNSWRRHIKLSGTPPDDVSYAWEDVKAMFNGGSRKRAMAASLTSISKQQQLRQQTANHSQARDALGEQLRGGGGLGGGHKRPRLVSSSPESSPSMHGGPEPTTPSPKAPISASQTASPYFPLVPVASKSYGPMAGPSNPFSPNSLASPGLGSSKLASSGSAHMTNSVAQQHQQSQQDFRQSFAEFMWAGKQPSLQLPYSCLLWPRPPGSMAGFTGHDMVSGGGGSGGLRHKMPPFPMSEHSMDSGLFSPHMADKGSFWDRQSAVVAAAEAATGRGSLMSGLHHMSAFKPVSKTGHSSGVEGKAHSSADGHGGQPVAVIPDRISSCSSPGQSMQSDDNEVDVIGGEDEDGDNTAGDQRHRHGSNTVELAAKYHGLDNVVDQNSGEKSPLQSEDSPIKSQSVNTTASAGSALDLRNLSALSKDEVQKVFLKDIDRPSRSEKELDHIRGPSHCVPSSNCPKLSANAIGGGGAVVGSGIASPYHHHMPSSEALEDHVRKEVAYREEVAKQLQLVRDALCQELDEECKARYAVQQKLKASFDLYPYFFHPTPDQ